MRKTFFLQNLLNTGTCGAEILHSPYLGISKPQEDTALINLLLSHLQYAGELDLAISISVSSLTCSVTLRFSFHAAYHGVLWHKMLSVLSLEPGEMTGGLPSHRG